MNKKGISNQALVTLAILALVVSVVGTLISLSKLETLRITGFASNITGTINITAGAATDISLPTATVNFGTMTGGEVNDTTDGYPAPFNISNDGNVCVNITIRRDQTNWLTGSVQGGNTSNNNNTMYQIDCLGIGCKSGTVTSWTNITNSTGVLAIAGLNFTSGNDTAQVEVKVNVPTDEIGGTKGTVVTFSATNSGAISGCPSG